MAMTFKGKVTFGVSYVIDSASEKALDDTVLSIARRVAKGETVSPFKRELLRVALEGGPEAAAKFCIKAGLRQGIKEMHDDLNSEEQKLCRFSPAQVVLS